MWGLRRIDIVLHKHTILFHHFSEVVSSSEMEKILQTKKEKERDLFIYLFSDLHFTLSKPISTLHNYEEPKKHSEP